MVKRDEGASVDRTGKISGQCESINDTANFESGQPKFTLSSLFRCGNGRLYTVPTVKPFLPFMTVHIYREAYTVN